jgi:hypothetical protein
MIKHLEQMKDNGDPLMVIELYQGDLQIALLPTKPSKILQSFLCQDD